MRTVPRTGGEKESPHISLDRHRDAVLWKLDGLDDLGTSWNGTTCRCAGC